MADLIFKKERKTHFRIGVSSEGVPQAEERALEQWYWWYFTLKLVY